MGIEDRVASDILNGTSGDRLERRVCLISISVPDLKHSELQRRAASIEDEDTHRFENVQDAILPCSMHRTCQSPTTEVMREDREDKESAALTSSVIRCIRPEEMEHCSCNCGPGFTPGSGSIRIVYNHIRIGKLALIAKGFMVLNRTQSLLVFIVLKRTSNP